MKSQPKMDEIEKAKKELILLYLGIKLRKESEVINIKLLIYIINTFIYFI